MLSAKAILQFCSDYPEDEFGKYYYAKLLRREERYEEAKELLETLDKSKNFMFQIDLIKCYIELAEYEKALSVIEELQPIAKDSTTKIFLSRAKFYAMKKLNRKPASLENVGYVSSQIYNYQEDLAKVYTKECTTGFDIDQLFEKIKANLEGATYVSSHTMLTDSYLFSVPSNQNIQETHLMEAITIHNTKDIIMIRRFKRQEKIEKYRINELKEEIKEEDIPSKQLSKFYKKYQKFL